MVASSAHADLLTTPRGFAPRTPARSLARCFATLAPSAKLTRCARSRATATALLPDTLPPRDRLGRRRCNLHRATDVVDIPPGQPGETLRFLLLSFGQLRPIA